MTTKALVTGANGWVGCFLVNKLVQAGVQVRAFIMKGTDLSWIKDLPLEVIYGDLSDPTVLETVVKDVDYIFHLAALKKGFTAAEFDQVNFVGTKYLLDAVQKINPGVKRFVYISTMAAVGPSRDGKPVNETTPCRPVSFYGSSKLKGEQETLRRAGQLAVTVVRPPIVYGPRDPDFISIFKNIARHREIQIGFGEKYLTLCYMDDLIDGIWLAAQQEKARGEIYFIADEQIYTYRQFYQAIADYLKVKTRKIIIPDTLMLLLGIINDWLAKFTGRLPYLNRQKAIESVQKYWLSDPSKARKELGFQAKVGLAEGVQRTAEWYKANNWL
jgi:nucleoside-diphosphate-sugar epimerase